jgi:phenylalanyl-tRNA synthetase alpha chain
MLLLGARAALRRARAAAVAPPLAAARVAGHGVGARRALAALSYGGGGCGRHSSSSSGGGGGSGSSKSPGGRARDFVAELVREGEQHNNITPSVARHIGRDLLNKGNHPLAIIKGKIFDFFAGAYRDGSGRPVFRALDNLDPVVSTAQAFDEILIPEGHVSRRLSDTFYVDRTTCLRPHTSAHQCELLRAGHRAFLVAGDVYRRDEIDQTHYPVFHQMEGVFVFEEAHVDAAQAEAHLKQALEGLVRTLFGEVETRWVPAYFPFTEPSLELEILFNGTWLEVLGCGVVHQDILAKVGLAGRRAWAFGLGIERLAMVLFEIPDIRLFWSEDRRFLEQFRDGHITKFKSYSKYPPCLKDISFWVPPAFHENDFFSVVREAGGDLVERVELIDKFTHPKTKRESQCYRINFRSMDRNLTNAEIDAMQATIRDVVQSKLKVELR